MSLKAPRTALIVSAVLFAACDSSGDRVLESAPCPHCETVDEDVPPAPVPTTEPPPPPFGTQGVTVHNDTDEPLRIASLPFGEAVIDSRLVTRELDLAIPSSTIVTPPKPTIIPARESRFFSSQVTVTTDTEHTVTSGAVLELGGDVALYVGRGEVRARRVGGVPRLVPEDSKVRVVPVRADAPTCPKPPSSVRLANFWFASHPTLSYPLTKVRSVDCTTVSFDWLGLSDPAKDPAIGYCGPDEAFPFGDGERVSVIPASLFTRAIRFERPDRSAAFEIAWLDVPKEGSIVIGDRTLSLEQDVSCVSAPAVHIDSSCREAQLHVRARDAATGQPFAPTTPINLPNATAWVVGLHSVAVSFECPVPFAPARVSLVARSPKL